MKKLIIVAILLLNSSIYAQDANVCKSSEKMMAFFVTYMISRDIKIITNENAINEMFQGIDEKLTKNVNKLCKEGKPLKVIADETFSICGSACEEGAKYYGKVEAVSALKKDCVKVCEVHLLAQKQFIQGKDDSVPNTDCVKPTGDKISELQQKAKEVEEKLKSLEATKALQK